MGESMRFLNVIEGLAVPAAKTGSPLTFLLLASTGMVRCFAGEPPEMSKGPDVELFGLAGHTSSLCPGVAGGKVDQSATYKSTGFGSI